MSDVFRRLVATSLCVQLTFLGMTVQGCAARQATTAPSANEFLTGAQSKEPTQLRQVLPKPYAELFDLVPTLQFTANEIRFQRSELEKGEDVWLVSKITLSNTQNKLMRLKRTSKSKRSA